MTDGTGRASDAGSEIGGLNGWVESILFVATLSVLNLAYSVGHAVGAHPVAFITIAMVVAAISLVGLTGLGPNWRAVVALPLSWFIGGCIIAMEAIYYLLLKFVSPADGSLLVRLNVPVAMAIGIVLLGRYPPRLSLVGAVMVLGGIAAYVPKLATTSVAISVGLGLLCAAVMSARAFAVEYHPWNRNARSVFEKMRVTGLVLGVTSLAGTAFVALLMGLSAIGVLAPSPVIPTLDAFLHVPTLLTGGFVGVFVLTAMQYLSFSTVVKIQTENFMAMNAFTPAMTMLFQVGATSLGILAPMPIEWHLLPPMAVVIAGVLVVIWAGRLVRN